MFGWEFPPHISGGLGTACYGVVTGLLQQGVQVIFVVPRLYGDENSEAFRLVSASDVLIDATTPAALKWMERLQYIEAHSPLAPYAMPESPETGREVKEKQQVLTTSIEPSRPQRFEMTGKYGHELMQEVHKYAVVASSIASSQDFDVIHAHDWLTYPAGIAAKEASGKPFVAHIHATEYDRSGENINQAVYDIEKEGMERADHVIAVSEYTRQMVIDKYGIDPEKVSVTHNGIISKNGFKAHPSKGVQEKIVTFMGRITYQKGPEYFVEAARKVLDVIPNVRFVMAGGGDMMTTMIERVADLKMSSRFHFTGFLNGPEVDKMYAMSDVFVMPSVSEPFGIAPLEAIQANVPVIISKQSGVSEVLKNAIKVDFWDVDALADAIAALLQYKSLSGLFRENGKSDLKELNWEKSASSIKEVYSQMLRSYVS